MGQDVDIGELKKLCLGGSFNLAFHEREGSVKVRKQEGQAGDVHVGNDGAEVGSVGDDDVNRTVVDRQGLNELAVAAELAGGINFRLDSAVGLLFDFFCEIIGCDVARVGIGGGNTDLQDDGVVRARADGSQSEDHGQSHDECEDLLHLFCSFLILFYSWLFQSENTVQSAGGAFR